MALLRSFVIGFKALFAKEQRSKEMDEELRGFLDAAAEDKMRNGMSHREAARTARVEMGSMEAVKEQVRSAGWESIIESLWQDIRYSFRMVAKSPGFTAIAVVSLALGIGANTAIFTLIHELLLKSLPVSAPHQLVSFGKEIGGGRIDGIQPGPLDIFPYDFYKNLNARQDLFKGICAYASFETTVSVRLSTSASEGAKQAHSHLVSGNFFSVLGATPILGRALTPADTDVPGREPVAVISYDFWRASLSADPSAIGRTIAINGTAFTVVGVMPETFYGVDLNEESPDMWLPVTMQTQVTLQPSMLDPRGLYWLHLMGRRNPGVSLGRIQTWITAHTQQYITDREGPQLSSTRKQEVKKIFVEALPGGRGISNLRAEYSEPLQILMGVVALVLLIACANLANFLMARASSRERELSTRLALGSGPARIMRQILTEALLLSFSGGAVGLLLAYWGTRALINFVAGGATHTTLAATPDIQVLLFTFGISLLTGVLFGLAPAMQVSRLSVTPSMQSNVRAAASAGGRTGRLIPKALVAFQVALSLMLLAGAGLFLRTLQNLQNQDFGFNRRSVLAVSFNAKFAGYKPEQLNALYGRILGSLNALPGVRSATLSGAPPISPGSWDSPIFVKGHPPQPNEDLSTLLNRVGPRYFVTLNIPVLSGRTIGPEDTEHSLKVVVVNQSLADHFFPHGDAIGHSFTVGDPSVEGEWQIVGVVRDAKYNSPRERPQRMAYLPVAQLAGDDKYAYVLQLQTMGDPANVTGEVRRALASVDPNLPVLEVQTVREQVDRRMANETLISHLSSFFSLLALSLAAIGLYGVMTYNVLRRANEIGIRMALGAPSREVLWMILQEALVLLTAGVAIGIPATLGATHFIQSQLFGLGPSDSLALGAATLVITAVTLISAYFPARRATRVDPMMALRYQ